MINPSGATAYYIRAILGSLNIHEKKSRQDICIFSNRRSGSTLLMQMIYSQKGIKFVDQPLDSWRYNPYNKIFRDIYKNNFFFTDKIHLTQLENYFNDVIFRGKLKGYSQWNYFDKNYKLFSDRLVIKILNALPFVDWFEEKFDIKIIYLIRHPISTSLSIIQRNWGNTAEHLLQNPYLINKCLNKKRLKFSFKILETGTNLEKFVLEWCLNNSYPLSICNDRKWLTISYEELILKPRQMVDLICNYLDLFDKERMLKTVFNPSRTASKKSKKDILEKDPYYLVNKWKNKIDNYTESKVMSILNEFGIDAYKKGRTLPSSTLLHFESKSDYE